MRSTLALSAALLLCCLAPSAQAQTELQMKADSFTGPVTQAETDSFLAYISNLQPAADNQRNAWAYGASGQAVQALALVYTFDRDVRLLDQLVRFCDAELAERNDLAPAPIGQHRIWTGRIDPAWPNDLAKDPLSTGGEQGDPVGNLASCAIAILKTPSVWHLPVPAGDPHGYGRTYLRRARHYVQQADVVVDGHILNGLLDLSHDGHQYFSAASPYKGGTPVPWNQQMMFNYAFQNLATAHQLLKDSPARVVRYRKLVADSMDWFFTQGCQTLTDKDGRPAYNWGYALPSRGGEDATHASMDIAGFYLAYRDGGYSVDRKKMTPFANTFLDVMTLGPQRYAGRVDGTSGSGHASPTSFVRSGYLLLAGFRPEAYVSLVTNAFPADHTTANAELFSRFLWIKNLRAHSGPAPVH